MPQALQLTNVKIAGFKSFVDPTNIELPSKMVAIVGPNGCGKSNIIDAVTWVMGESSPKYLRGESLTDVIFNGSNGRKPVGQASVELVFDNQGGMIGGEYAQYAEISVKRVINRESDSTYYLNGARCRKRDVVAIFLGTGLGPRSYSIIGQNMISRVIEAKPEELRNHLEEAAGISVYKERRRETELRIQHTNENLARVNDVRVELEKQLKTLEHQANVAEKFKTLKQQERTLKAEWYGIQWRQLDGRMVEHTLQIQREETALEARLADLSGTDRDMEQMRNQQRAAQEAFQEVQRRYYAVGNEITRIEQEVLHHQERKQQWDSELNQTEHDWKLVKDQQDEADDELRELDLEIQEVEPQLAGVRKEVEALHHSLSAAEEGVQTWQNRWDEFNSTSAKTAQIAQVEQTRILHLEQRIASVQKRQAQLQEEQGRINFSELTKELESFSKQAYEVADVLENHKAQLQTLRQEMQALQSAQQASHTNLDTVRSELQRLRGHQASLEALQQTALGQSDHVTAPWVEEKKLSQKPRLAQSIEVEKGWEFAVEKVLGFCLQAICVDDVQSTIPDLADFKSGNLCIFTPNAASAQQGNNGKTTLLQKIKSPWALDSFISGIYVADSLNEALTLCESLSVHESVITPDGFWINRAWIKVLREEDAAAGVFQRETELKLLAARIEHEQATQLDLEQQIEARRTQIQLHEDQLDELQQTYNQHQAQSAQLNAQQKVKHERLGELKTQSERYLAELSDCEAQLAQAQSEFTHARSAWQQALSDLEEQANLRETLMSERDKARQQLQTLRDSTNQRKK